MKILSTLTVWAVLCAALPAQDQDKLPSGLDERIAQALRTNPEVMMAEAKIREAEAAYRETRLRITQEVMQAHNDMESQRRLIEQTHREFRETAKLRDQGLIAEADVVKSESAIIRAENDLGQVRARLQYLMGLDPGAPITATGNQGAASLQTPDVTRPALTSGQEAMLNRTLIARFNDTPFSDVIDSLNMVLAKGEPTAAMVVNGYALESWGVPLEELFIQMNTEQPVTVRNFLSAVADVHGLCFVIRDYGILVTLEDQAQMLYAPVIPVEVELHPSVGPPAGAVRAR